MPSPFRTSDFPPDPYPGARPGVSFVELDGTAWVLLPDSRNATWDVATSPTVGLDSWLEVHGATATDERLPLLAYGSNASPGKLDWLRHERGLTGPAVILEADIVGVTAVWSAGVRARDGQRPAVLAAEPGHTERHAVWLVTPEQLAVLDNAEGRGERYRLVWVHAPTAFANGQQYDWVLAYVARSEAIGRDVPVHLNRSPLLVDGSLIRVSDVDQEAAMRLSGTLAESDGLEVVHVANVPAWADLGGRLTSG